MKLPDGSIVWLNADSKLSYSESFSRKNRNVRLEGEGYFEVEHGEHPFVIQTDSAQIKVLGTKFNVKNYGDENYIKVSLLEGSIVLLCINQEDGSEEILYRFYQLDNLLSLNGFCLC